MDKGILSGFGITQIGIVVRDVNRAAEKFGRLVGMEVSAEEHTSNMDLDTWYHRGEQVGSEAIIKAFRFGNIELEFIQPLSGKNTWKEYLDEKGEGIHHIAFKVKGTKELIAKMENEGYGLIGGGEMPGGRFAYLDTTEDIKTIVEFLEFDD